MIVEKSTQKVLGVHYLGPNAGETIQNVGIALTAGLTKASFDNTLAIHPTNAEEFVLMKANRPGRVEGK